MRLPFQTLALIQAPMAGVQDECLALAAADAGAIGSLAAAMLPLPALEHALQRLRDAGRPYNVNFFAHVPPPPAAAFDRRWLAALAPYYDELGLPLPGPGAAVASRQPFCAEAAELLEAVRPPIVSFHFGLPEPALLARVHRWGAFVLASATTLDEALWLQARGVDAVIAQGLEAGGHRGHFLDPDPARQLDTATLVSALVARLDVPVIAAGGIADAAGVRAVMERGAAAVQCGTAFLLCDEARTSALHRARLREPSEPTALTNLFSGGLARGLVNRAMRELGPLSAVAPPFPLASAALAPLRERAEALGRDDFTPLWSGTRRDGCREAPAAEVVKALAAGFDA
ncbi:MULTISPECIES: nitronate monooxygenase family protein [unclassified Rubrivivax]|uniref:NAD(P)H-dependent flavin oxidoreductase n=1 Tax=unclassified Rubrivivax TaxID=2649762 RepID=UPI001E547AE6|nr:MULTISPECIES: nitronate monooxygenase [unclassified Rubrivivax]MCC9597473.1 nitronate monooxygenase [Rubrivivax sp. JA1055]MCC9646269.1 nitronate monooxygenase [Rubrivivax sp. JA1029]